MEGAVTRGQRRVQLVYEHINLTEALGAGATEASHPLMTSIIIIIIMASGFWDPPSTGFARFIAPRE
jgi:hypothetical protein